jgi:hypothetical protein
MRTRLLALLILCCSAAPSLAWNSLGHKTVAEIAWRQLEPTTRQAIVDTIRRHPRFDKDFENKMDDKALTGDKAVEDHWIFQQAATWPDIIRKQKEVDRPNWHYIDLPFYLDPSDRQAFAGRLPVNIATDFPTKVPPEQYNVLQALAYCEATLKGNAGPENKAAAYCWLFHLVGDLHQPLHCTALFSADQFPKGDRGGNKIPLRRGKNLHSLWDGLLGSQYYMRDVAKAADELSDKSRFGDVWETATKEMDPHDWADESHSICESVVYDDAILDAVRQSTPGEKLEQIDLPTSYYKAAGEEARKRVLTGGLRLGAMLNNLGNVDAKRSIR